MKQMLFVYNAPASVTFSVTVDARAYNFVLPLTTGFVKAVIQFGAPLIPLKGLLFTYGATSTQGFQVSVSDLEVFVKQWGSSGPYMNWKKFGSIMGAGARV